MCAAYLSQDKVLCKEIRDGIDRHTENQKRFKLPTRLVAKTFVFRILYGGSEYAFANDPEFNWISRDVKYWKRVIEEFYSKYTGLREWHESLVDTAIKTGQWTSPTGRQYTYEPKKNMYGKWVWPRTVILNYPVQGFAADLMSIARVSAYKRLKDRVLFVNSVHDSILVDSPNGIVYDICIELERVFEDVPSNFEKIFKQEFNLLMKGEVKYGMNWKDMNKFNKEEYNKNAN